MANKIKFISSGFRRILTGAGTRRAVNDAAHRMSSGVPGSKVRQMVGGYGGGRQVAFVMTNPKTAKESEQQREALESAVHGA